jgi:hypothetical protein
LYDNQSIDNYYGFPLPYFSTEKAVGVRNTFSIRSTIIFSASLAARLAIHSASAWNAFHLVSRSARLCHFSR